MMKFLFSLIMLIPLCFISEFWLMQFMFFILSFLFFFNISMSYLWTNISNFLGNDLLSFSLILLSFWICSLMILSSEKIFKLNNFSNLFLFIMVNLMLALYLAFSSMNLFIFYLFFEISLIPTLILIIGWGYQPERIEAGIYLLFYTLMVSLPMMISIFYYYEKFFSLDFYFMTNDLKNLFMYLCMNFVFFVKMPMFFVHLWLPKAHVEAPVSGSMILAGIMLKLGGYGLMRVMNLFLTVGMKFNFIFIIISLMGGFFVSLMCLRQSDIKSLIAYSSVAHMGLVLGGIMTLNIWGFWGSLIMMLAHGLCSSGLFCLANISYERLMSRSLYLNKGLINIFPSLSLWWFLFSSSNMAAPPSLNLLGEILLINSLVSFSSIFMIFLSLISFFSAAYSLFLYAFSQHGVYYSGMYSIYSGFFREYLLLFLHWFPLNILILKSEYFVLWI
uniref:NADH-ubiquinone oxidoreductase chain 4 n=2 Tax=Monochamus alternatus TaxID=192382 RepID=A0A0U1WND7_MONAT|nr:NADH dehydrogenase subunit 4 [Monochamus alternatus]YP_009913600.1 NADH dehydrogenase subunit 4 [Monochamus alternatus alternatus]AIG22815.1 NADH dehydrogenase subunit 4 [Monochamus alternatus]QLM01486.1 NADH dehydrogenase subunit 4 [Monochamus alternatus alternatus]QWM97280.1 NADH dehydrogenase subunit 4 [Monochamus alternatus]